MNPVFFPQEYQKIIQQKDEKYMDHIQQQNILQQTVNYNKKQQQNNNDDDPPPQIYDFLFMPPPISQSSKYLNQLQGEIIQKISKQQHALDYLTILGQKRPFELDSKKIPEPVYVDQGIKSKMKKMVKNIHEKMIQNLKYCAGDMPTNYNSPMPKISQKCIQFMNLCGQIKVAQTKTVIWKTMQQQTQKMNQKSQQIQKLIDHMTQYCRLQEPTRSRSF